MSIFLIAMAVAGCTSSSPGTNAPTATTTASTSAPTGPSLNDWRKAWNFDQLHWYTYTDHGTYYKIAYSNEVYNGVPARKITEYYGTDPGSLSIMRETYYDPANNKFLNGTDYVLHKAFTSSEFSPAAKDVYFELDPYLHYGYDPATGAESRTAAQTEKATTSTDSVTIAKGTFACTKYADGMRDTFWVSRDAPLPVKYNNGVTSYTWEPTDWG